jgi:hypothetical protein
MAAPDDDPTPPSSGTPSSDGGAPDATASPAESPDGGAPDSTASPAASPDGGTPTSSDQSAGDSPDGGLPPGGVPDGSLGQAPVAAAPDNVVSVNVPLQAAGSAVTLSFNPSGPVFPIDEQCNMPTVTVTATLQGFSADPANPPQFAWKATLTYDGANCAHSVGRHTSHPEMTQVGPANTFLLPFTAVRGGNLTIAVTVTQGSLTVSQTSQNLQVTGTNPSIAALRAYAPADVAFRKLMQLESGLRQFSGPLCPKFSQDNFGGVGLCQMTNPAPTDDQVWSWKANVDAGFTLFQSKRTTARGYPGTVRADQTFQNLVIAYQANNPAVTAVTLPEFTAEQLQRDTLRGFNGYPRNVHEYRVQLDTAGGLVVTVDPATNRGTVAWEFVTVQARIAVYDRLPALAQNHRGDPNYVSDVVAQAGF